jgi:hypothetical protein
VGKFRGLISPEDDTWNINTHNLNNNIINHIKITKN